MSYKIQTWIIHPEVDDWFCEFEYLIRDQDNEGRDVYSIASELRTPNLWQPDNEQRIWKRLVGPWVRIAPGEV